MTVEELVSVFQNGTGMGELFHAYGGKPALLGVGHVRKALKQMDDSAPALEATAEPTGEATVSPMTGDHQPKDKGGKPPKDPKPKGKPEKPPKPKGKDK